MLPVKVDVMVDQAEALRRLVLQRTSQDEIRERRGGLLVVVSAQSGAGSTTIARQMALKLYRHAWNVGLVEVTQGGHLTGAWERSPGEPTWQDVAMGKRTLREAWRPGPCGLPTVCSRDHGQALAIENNRQIEPSGHSMEKDWGAEQLQLAARSQWIVVDAGQGPTAGPFLTIADECCLVVDADPEKTNAQYAEIKRLASHLRGARCWLLINRIHDGAAASTLQQRLVATAGRFLNLALLPLGDLPDEPLEEALDELRLPNSDGAGTSEWRVAMRRIVQRWEDAQAAPWNAIVRC